MRGRWQSLLGTAVVGFGWILSAEAAPVYRGKALKIVDGDTIQMTLEGVLQRDPRGGQARWIRVPAGRPQPPLSVRLIGIDTPESHFFHGGTVHAQQPWGDAATSFLAARLPIGTEIVVEAIDETTYGRAIGRIHVLRNPRDVNLEMVRAGWTPTLPFCPGAGGCVEAHLIKFDVYRYADACAQARSARLGIWNAQSPLPEQAYEFRARLTGNLDFRFAGSLRRRVYVDGPQYRQIDPCDRIFFQQEADALLLGYRKLSTAR